MNPRTYPKTRAAAVELAIATIRGGLSIDRAFDAGLEGGPAWNRHAGPGRGEPSAMRYLCRRAGRYNVTSDSPRG